MRRISLKTDFSLQQPERVPKLKTAKQPIFSSVRFRILVWYFVLTTCTVLVSVGVTRHIFCNVLESRTQEALINYQ